MKQVLRFIVPLALLLGLIGYALAPVANHMVSHWFEGDVKLRSQLIFTTVRDTVNNMLREGNIGELEGLFHRVSEDERILVMGICANGKLIVSSGPWPSVISCPTSSQLSSDDLLKSSFKPYRISGGATLLSTYPVGASPSAAALLILQDLSFIERRSSDTQFYLAGLLAFVGVIAAAITVLVAKVALRRWIRSLHMTPPPYPEQKSPDAHSHRFLPELSPVAGEIRQILRDLDAARSSQEGLHADWSADTLRRLLESDLPGAEIIVVSNREPYIHNRGANGEIILQHPAGGVVTALEPITRACGGVWIAHGSGSADRDVVDENDRLGAPPESPSYTLRRVWLTEEEENGYYYGLANEGLWPLCHICFVRPIFREADWAQYVAVNQKFSDAVIHEAKTDNPIVLIQDYHFALAPRMIREKLPNAIIVTFWHIPWPNSEVFSIFPWKKHLIDGLLGSSIIGFHTRFHCNNFIDTVDRFIECRIDREEAMISISGHGTLVRPYPISIEWPPLDPKDQSAIIECRQNIRARHALASDVVLAVGVERLDFTKGIPDRFTAVDSFLTQHPEWIGRFTYLQVAAPTRSKLPSYRAIQEETVALAASINAKYAQAGSPPIVLLPHHHEPEEIHELFRAADICIVTSLHDGMNLVAKEFVASRDDESGVLILSTFAGASRELLEALIVNPYDTAGMAEAINQAVRMTPDQQRERMALMRNMVREHNVFRWAGRMLLDAARLRKRNHIDTLVATELEG